MKIKDLKFDGEYMLATDEEGNVYRQSMLWYPRLMDATDEERSEYTFSSDGIHWRKIDEDISFESFLEHGEPTAFQRIFLTHREINYSRFARRIGISPTLFSNYINGFKKPSKERENEIIKALREMGRELSSVQFV